VKPQPSDSVLHASLCQEQCDVLMVNSALTHIICVVDSLGGHPASELLFYFCRIPSVMSVNGQNTSIEILETSKEMHLISQPPLQL
jgi:hypothetical protein